MADPKSNLDEQKVKEVKNLSSESTDNEVSNPHANPPVNYAEANGRNQSKDRRLQKKLLHVNGYSSGR